MENFANNDPEDQNIEPTMEDVESGYDYWGINKEDIPEEIKKATLAMMQDAMTSDARREGGNVYKHAIQVVTKAHEDSYEFSRAVNTVPGLLTAMAETCSLFVELLEKNLGIQIKHQSGEHQGMPINSDIAGIVASGVELCMALGYIAKQSVEYEETLNNLWGDTGIATKEQEEAKEKARTSNEGVDFLEDLPEIQEASGGECMDCGKVFETDAALTKHALAEHAGE